MELNVQMLLFLPLFLVRSFQVTCLVRDHSVLFPWFFSALIIIIFIIYIIITVIVFFFILFIYRGCEHYHNILKESNRHRNITQRTQPTHTNTNDNTIQPSGNLQQSRSYTEVTRSNTYQFEDTAIALTKFIDEFKGLFNQLLQQSSMILNMLTKLINKND